MFGRIDIVYDHRDEALTIPRSALIEKMARRPYSSSMQHSQVPRRLQVERRRQGKDRCERGKDEGDRRLDAGFVIASWSRSAT
jgi:hypothetical protein